MQAERRASTFDPEQHRDQLLPLLRAIAGMPLGSAGHPEPACLDEALRRHPREGRGFFSRSQLIAGYRHFARTGGAGGMLPLSEAEFVRRVQLRPVRTLSGVTPITVLTKPFPCPGRCVFCPNDRSMPKSYLADEPGAQRAAQHEFDPYRQTFSRLEALRAIGHPTEKVELIVLGGTWSFHPEPYQVWFALRCFEAMNDFGQGRDGRAAARVDGPDFAGMALEVGDREAARGRYNADVSRLLTQASGGALLANHEHATWEALARAQRSNERADSRCVGFSVETRPDHVDDDEVRRLRRLGCTKVQIGLQSLSDAILVANQRGHDVADARAAVTRLRAAGFKVQAHWMPNLLGSTPTLDLDDYARLFDDEALRPDELKVYPCSLIESAELMVHYRSGAWKPYTHEELLEVLMGALEQTPRYCRITRMIRDISSDDIVQGNKLTNFRQIAEQGLARRGGRCEDIRSREIRDERFEIASLALRVTRYATSIGEEVFLEFVTPDDRIVGFLRLALPSTPAAIDELRDSALIREVHVYGGSLEVGSRTENRAQHRGLGQRLVEEAARLARAAGHADLAVISAVGTRPYYRRLGFEDGVLYQHRAVGDGVGLRAGPRGEPARPLRAR